MGGMKDGWLAQLAPAHAPPSVGWWPPAPGWWGLALVVLLVLAAWVLWWRQPRNRLRRWALAELRRIAKAGSEEAALARAVEDLMRRHAMARYGPEQVAILSGETWLAFVAREGGDALAGDAGRSLLRLAYGGSGPGERALWLAGARGFIRGRRRAWTRLTAWRLRSLRRKRAPQDLAHDYGSIEEGGLA